jgi:hypothetical protein
MNKLPLPIIDNSSIPEAGGLQHHQVRRLNVANGKSEVEIEAHSGPLLRLNAKLLLGFTVDRQRASRCDVHHISSAHQNRKLGARNWRLCAPRSRLVHSGGAIVGIVAIVIVLGCIAYEVTKLVAHAGNTTTSTPHTTLEVTRAL